MVKREFVHQTVESPTAGPRIVARLERGHLHASITEYDFDSGQKQVVVFRNAKSGRSPGFYFERDDLPLLIELAHEVMESLAKGATAVVEVSAS